MRRLAPPTAPRLTHRESAYSLLVLAVCIISQVCTKTLLWFPAIPPGFSIIQRLSAGQMASLVATGNAETFLCVLGSLMRDAYSSRITA